MKEETKEEYLARMRNQNLVNTWPEIAEEGKEESRTKGLKRRLKSLFFLVLLALFMWAVFMIFGMLKSN